MKINEVVFFGFTQKELEEIRKETKRTGNEEFTSDFAQEVADMVGMDVVTYFQPGGQVALIKS